MKPTIKSQYQNYGKLAALCLLIVLAVAEYQSRGNETVYKPVEPTLTITYCDTVYAEHGDVMILREREQSFSDSDYVWHSEIRK